MLSRIFIKLSNGFTRGLLTIAMLCLGFASTYAAIPAPFEVQTLVSGLNQPTTMVQAPDGRWFVALKDGNILVVKNGQVLPSPLITIPLVNTYGDRGLIGLAIDPSFDINGFIYASYTYENTPGSNVAGPKTGRLVRFKVVGDSASYASALVLTGNVSGNITTPSCEQYAYTDDCIPSDTSSHSVGGLGFGPDGKLYATFGDGAHFDYVDPRAMRAQNIDSLGGKMIRINKDGTAPADNPFFNGSSTANRSKVYAWGLRNSFRFVFSPSSGELFAGDVGWSSYEEINKIVKGANYGWPCMEGRVATAYGCTVLNATAPISAYAHDSNGAGSVVLGAFGYGYGTSTANTLFFGDYAQNFVRTLHVNLANPNDNAVEFMSGVDGALGPVSFVNGIDGNVYFISIYNGSIRRIVSTVGNRQPNANLYVSATSGALPLVINVSAASSTDPDGDSLTYEYNFGDGTSVVSTTSSRVSHTYTVNGNYNLYVVVRDGKGGASTASTLVRAGNRAPVINSLSPIAGTLYTALDTITASATATDFEDINLPSSAYSWTAILHHNIHTHVLQTCVGRVCSFVAPDHEAAPDVFTEIILTVKDSGGASISESIFLYQNTAAISTGNMIANPNLANTVDGVATSPMAWNIGGYGANVSVYEYPVTGVDDNAAIRVRTTAYTSGDAKWVFLPVTALGNTSYTYAGYYKTNVSVGVYAQFTSTANVVTYRYLGDLSPSATEFATFNISLTTPVGTKSISVYPALTAVGELTIDNLSLVPTALITAPEIDFVTPLAEAVISTTTTLSVHAHDIASIESVKVYAGNVLVGSDKSEPYDFVLNVLGMPRGTTTLVAVAKNIRGMFSTSTITVYVLPPVETEINLVKNGSFEEVVSLNAPRYFNKGGWGTNSSIFTLASPGKTGANAASINVSAYTNGDAKWYEDEVPVLPNHSYKYSEWYMSNVATVLFYRVTTSTGAFRYVTLAANVLPSATGTVLSSTFVTPSDAKSITIFHAISKVGILTIDDLKIVDNELVLTDATLPLVTLNLSTTTVLTSGNVLITGSATDNVAVSSISVAVDGVVVSSTTLANISINFATASLGSHTVTLNALDNSQNSASISATFNVVSGIVSTTTPNSTNLIVNGDFELVGASGDPVGFLRGGWGGGVRALNYPVVGISGSKAVSSSISTYVDGDIKWYPVDINVNSGTVYTFKDWSRSSTISDVIGRYTMADGSYLYFGVAKEIQPGTVWKESVGSFTPPTNARSVTFMHLISAVGYLDVDNMSLTANGTTTPANDITPPTINITSPANDEVINGVKVFGADVFDAGGLLNVWFAIDGNPVSEVLTSAPFAYNFDSSAFATGTHLLKVTATDLSGNNITATRTMTVVRDLSRPELLKNPTFSLINTDGSVLGFNKGGWGTNDRVLTYTASSSSLKTTISNITDGDAKWFADEVQVVGGNNYVWSESYLSNVNTSLVIRSQDAAGVFSYFWLKDLTSAIGLQQVSATFTAPQNSKSVTVFHILNSVGNLELFSASLKSN